MKPKAVIKDIIFLGTGTSSSVPNVRCLTDPSIRCLVCPTTLTDPNSKNRRRNTSLLIQFALAGQEDQELRNVIIDTGKTFYEGSLRWFVEYDIKKIDAVVLTHGHAGMILVLRADAILGLDDLRPWTVVGPGVVKSLPIHLSRETYQTVSEMFPYIVNTEKATGGGDVPSLEFHVFDDKSREIDVFGLEMIPLKVEHGQFSSGVPYFSYGFRFGNITYISDVSYIPEETHALINGSECIIIDALRPTPHLSHFSIPEALTMLGTFSPQPWLSLLVGFTHQLSHDELSTICQEFTSTGKIIIKDMLVQVEPRTRQQTAVKIDKVLETRRRRDMYVRMSNNKEAVSNTIDDFNGTVGEPEKVEKIGEDEDGRNNAEGLKVVPTFDGLRIEFPLTSEILEAL